MERDEEEGLNLRSSSLRDFPNVSEPSRYRWGENMVVGLIEYAF